MLATRENLKALIDAGVGCIDVSKRTIRTEVLVEIAGDAARAGTTLKVSGDKRRDDLLQIVRAGTEYIEVVYPANKPS